MPSSHRTALVLLLALALFGTAAMPAQVNARAPPTPVCGVCTGALDGAAANHGVALERDGTELTVTVRPNGTTRWRATIELARGADALRNASLRRQIVTSAVDVGVAEPVDVESHLRDRTLIVTFSDPTAAETHLGVTVFTPLVSEGPSVPFAMGGEGARYLGVDSLTVRTPSPHGIYGDYEGVSESARAVTWTRGDAERRFIEGDPRVAVVPDGTLGAGVRAAFARLLA